MAGWQSFKNSRYSNPIRWKEGQMKSGDPDPDRLGLEQALARVMARLTRGGREASLLREAADMLFTLRRYREAAHYYEEYAESRPSDARAWYLCGLADKAA